MMIEKTNILKGENKFIENMQLHIRYGRLFRGVFVGFLEASPFSLGKK